MASSGSPLKWWRLLLLVNHIACVQGKSPRFTAEFSAALRAHSMLEPGARSVLALGGRENLETWWSHDFNVVHGAMGDRFKEIVAAPISAQVLDWEPCGPPPPHAGSDIPIPPPPLPFVRWALDVLLMTSTACFGSWGAASLLAFEIDRVLRPNGLVVTPKGVGGKVVEALVNKLGWPAAVDATLGGTPVVIARRPSRNRAWAKTKASPCAPYANRSGEPGGVGNVVVGNGGEAERASAGFEPAPLLLPRSCC